MADNPDIAAQGSNVDEAATDADGATQEAPEGPASGVALFDAICD